MWNELKLETLTPEQKDLLGLKLSEFPLMTLNHLGKRIQKIGTSYLWSIPPNVILIGLVSYVLGGCIDFSVLLMAYQRTTYTYLSQLHWKHRSPMDTLC